MSKIISAVEALKTVNAQLGPQDEKIIDHLVIEINYEIQKTMQRCGFSYTTRVPISPIVKYEITRKLKEAGYSVVVKQDKNNYKFWCEPTAEAFEKATK